MNEDKSVEMMAEIVAAYVSNHTVRLEDVPQLMKLVHSTLKGFGEPESAPEAEPTAKATPGQVRKSISENGLVSFEDGKTYKTLKRHLTTRGMTFQQYKAKWGLPNDYPSTSPAYSAARSAMAISIGLGRKPGVRGPAKPKAVKATGAARGRPRKDATPAE